MIQSKEELDNFHTTIDPWGYETNSEDIKRRDILLSEIPPGEYENVLEIGCGQGFISQVLPGKNIFCTDISVSAIAHAQKSIIKENVSFHQASVFTIDKVFKIPFDLVIIGGVLYKQYIGNASSLIYLLVDKILKKNGILVSVHIDEWYKCQFPYKRLKQVFYDYREYIHNLEVYRK